LRLVERADEARREYEELWHKFNPQDVKNQLAYAWAALMTGEHDAALQILASRAGDRVSGLSVVRRYLGFRCLLRGEFASAREHFDQAIDLADSLQGLDVWLVGDFEAFEVLQLLAGQPHAETGREMLEQCNNTPDTPIYLLGGNLVSLIAKGIQRDGEAAARSDIRKRFG
jgi:hypothetical protein